MDKTKLSLVAAPIVISIICIFLAVNVAVARSQLNAEKAIADSLRAQIVDIRGQLVEAQKQSETVRELRDSLDRAQKELAAAKQEAMTLNEQKTDLEARLNSAMEALQEPAGTDTKTEPVSTE